MEPFPDIHVLNGFHAHPPVEALFARLAGAALPVQATAARAVVAAVPTPGIHCVDITVGDGTVLQADSVDTEAPLDLDTNTPGAQLSLQGPSWLDLPLR